MKNLIVLFVGLFMFCTTVIQPDRPIIIGTWAGSSSYWSGDWYGTIVNYDTLQFSSDSIKKATCRVVLSTGESGRDSSVGLWEVSGNGYDIHVWWERAGSTTPTHQEMYINNVNELRFTNTSPDWTSTYKKIR